MLIFHIAVAIASIILSTSSFAWPSRARLAASYLFIAATLLSGAVLVLQQPAHLGMACQAGIIYLVLVVPLTAGAARRTAPAAAR